jgi:MFS family permease
MVYPVMLPHLQTEYGLNLRTTGLLLTVLWSTYAIGQLPGGMLTDEFGERNVLSASTLMSAAMLFFVITAEYTLILFVTTALLGFTTALYGVARYTAISKMFSAREGAAIGVTLAAGNIGNAILPAIAGAIAAVFVWQFGFGFSIPLFLLVTIFLWAVVPRDTLETAGDAFTLNSARSVLAELFRFEIFLITVMLILGVSVWQIFTGFYPTYLIEVKGLSPTVAAGLFSVFFGFAIFIQPLSGAVYDRIGIRRTLPIFLGITAVGFIILFFSDGVWTLAGVTVLLGCMTSTVAVTMPYLTGTLSEEVQGTGLGLLRTSYMLVGAVSPTAFGTIAEAGYFAEGFSALALLIVGMIGIVSLLPEYA